MATILDRRYGKKDSIVDLAGAIKKVAKDKNRRILLEDDLAWAQRKLDGIARLSKILCKKLAAEAKGK